MNKKTKETASNVTSSEDNDESRPDGTMHVNVADDERRSSDNALQPERPGAMLRALREQQGISLRDIHNKTQISISKLKLLEEDKYDAFEAEVFVSGYIRNYAKALGTDPKPLMDSYRLWSDTTDYAEQDSSPEHDGGADKRELKPVLLSRTSIGSAVTTTNILPFIFGCIFLVLVAGVYFFLSLPDETSRVLSRVGDDTTANQKVVALAKGEREPVLDASTLVPEGVDVELQHDEPAVSESVATQSPVPIPSPKAEFVASQSDLIETQVPEVDRSAVQSELVFSFSEDCWVQVIDASGNKIFADIQYKGDNLRLFGEPPLKVTLGNAAAAVLLVDGAVVSTAPIGTNKTRRLTVGTSQ